MRNRYFALSAALLFAAAAPVFGEYSYAGQWGREGSGNGEEPLRLARV